MDKVQTFQEFLAQETARVDLATVGLSLAVCLLMSGVLAFFYTRIGSSLGNRHKFAKTLVPLAATTLLVIAVVKTSLALSLGLVGALSIVRFRAAIKEPEELTYLFLAIGIGLGCGANQLKLTFAVFAVTLVVLIARSRVLGRPPQGMLLSVTMQGAEHPSFDELIKLVAAHSKNAGLKRVDEEGDAVEALFVAEFDDMTGIERLLAALREQKGVGRVSVLSPLEA